MSMEIIDTHVHIWDFQKARYEWLDGDSSILNRTYSIDELSEQRLQAGVSKGILVQAANNPEDSDFLLEVIENTPWLAGLVGWLPLTDPVSVERALIRKYLKNKHFKGVRHLIHNEASPTWLLQDRVIESLKILSEIGLPYDVVGVVPEHIETALKLSELVPGLRMVFDHLNQPPIARRERFGRWGELMKEAAGRPQFHVKISGLGTASGNFTGWTPSDLEPYIQFALEHFGVDRCFCGGDWPVSLLAGDYLRTWEAYKTIFTGLLDEAGLHKVLYANAARFYALD